MWRRGVKLNLRWVKEDLVKRHTKQDRLKKKFQLTKII
jgi:hypothetical protein